MKKRPGPPPPLPSRLPGPASSPGFLLWKVSNAWQRRQRAALEPFGLTHSQFVLLATATWFGASETLTQARLCRAFGRGSDDHLSSRACARGGSARRAPDPPRRSTGEGHRRHRGGPCQSAPGCRGGRKDRRGLFRASVGEDASPGRNVRRPRRRGGGSIWRGPRPELKATMRSRATRTLRPCVLELRSHEGGGRGYLSRAGTGLVERSADDSTSLGREWATFSRHRRAPGRFPRRAGRSRAAPAHESCTFSPQMRTPTSRGMASRRASVATPPQQFR